LKPTRNCAKGILNFNYFLDRCGNCIGEGHDARCARDFRTKFLWRQNLMDVLFAWGELPSDLQYYILNKLTTNERGQLLLVSKDMFIKIMSSPVHADEFPT
jgi:hypothetical protein